MHEGLTPPTPPFNPPHDSTEESHATQPAVGSPVEASSNLFDTNTSSVTVPPPPYLYAGEGSALSPPGSEGEVEGEEDAATWAALNPARPTDSSSSTLSEAEGEEGEASAARPRPLTVRLSVAVGPERAATPGEMRRGMGLQLTPREDDWEDFYYLYSDGFGEGTVCERKGAKEGVRSSFVGWVLEGMRSALMQP